MNKLITSFKYIIFISTLLIVGCNYESYDEINRVFGAYILEDSISQEGYAFGRFNGETKFGKTIQSTEEDHSISIVYLYSDSIVTKLGTVSLYYTNSDRNRFTTENTGKENLITSSALKYKVVLPGQEELVIYIYTDANNKAHIVDDFGFVDNQSFVKREFYNMETIDFSSRYTNTSAKTTTLGNTDYYLLCGPYNQLRLD